MELLEINDVQKKYPRWYKFWTLIPWLVASWIVIWILVWYTWFIFFWYWEAIFGVWTLILIYYLWWLIRWCDYIVSTTSALFELKKYERIDFNNVLYAPAWYQEKALAQKIIWDMWPEEVIQWCMIPMYNEDPAILYETVEAISLSSYDLSKVAITIHWEAHKQECFEAALEKCMPLASRFWFFWYTLHKLLPGEIPWKWANITYWVAEIYPKILEHFNTTPDKVLVTTLDADNKVDKAYFSTLTYTYISTPDRKHASYQPVIFFFNNFWQAPFFSKVVSLFNTFWILFNFTKKYWPRNFSSHAQPLDALIELHFWSKQTIVEDWHQYWRSFFWFHGKYQCIPVYAKIYHDCNLSSNMFKTIKAQYNQMRRWAHGAQDIPYTRCMMLEQRKVLPKSRVLFEFGRSLEWILLWSTLHIVLLAWLAFSFMKDVELSSYISLGSAISIFTNIAFTLTITSLLLSLIIFPFSSLPTRRERIKKVTIFLIYFFIFVGPSLITFSWLPAFHTQIAIMLWKPLKKFNVTKKVR